MKFAVKLATFLLVTFSISQAAIVTTQARIVSVETFPTGVLLWLTRLSGTTLPSGNSGYFNQVSGTRLILADNSTEINDRKSMLSVAFTAYSMGNSVWISWDDQTQKIAAFMVSQ